MQIDLEREEKYKFFQDKSKKWINEFICERKQDKEKYGGWILQHCKIQSDMDMIHKNLNYYFQDLE